MQKPSLQIVVGLGNGDEGKGTMVDYFRRRSGARLVIRFNGGPQAGHNVVTPQGVWHCFSQFGAGSLVPGTGTFLSSEMLIEPVSLMREAETLQQKGRRDILSSLAVDPGSTVITPVHKMIGQMLEISRGKGRFGSCGQGVGQAVADREQGKGFCLRDLRAPNFLDRYRALSEEKFAEAGCLLDAYDTDAMRERYNFFAQYAVPPGWLLALYEKFSGGLAVTQGYRLHNALSARESIVFEGAQGALLDHRGGFSPYVTKTRSTFHNVENLLGVPITSPWLLDRYSVEKVGVLRAYGHRHGVGPFVTEDGNLSLPLADARNQENPWQGKFRVGWLDLVALRYGIALNNGVGALALTGLDQLSGLEHIRVCTAYRYTGELNALDPYFTWEQVGGQTARITAFRTDAPVDRSGELARLLFECQPQYTELPGWDTPIRGMRRFADLPVCAQSYVLWLQSPDGLNAPIRYLSIGTTADDKLVLP